MMVVKQMADAGRLAYVDTSVLIAASGTDVLSEWALSALWGNTLVSSALARVELARFAHRTGYGGQGLREMEARVSFVNVDDQAIAAAIAVSGEVEALDAIHVGTWARLYMVGVDCPFITADRKQAAAAAGAGAQVLHPFGDDLA